MQTFEGILLSVSYFNIEYATVCKDENTLKAIEYCENKRPNNWVGKQKESSYPSQTEKKGKSYHSYNGLSKL